MTQYATLIIQRKIEEKKTEISMGREKKGVKKLMLRS